MDHTQLLQYGFIGNSLTEEESNRPPFQVLVVEDESIVALELKARLEDMGYRVLGTVSSGEKALEIIRQHPPDLIIMDIRLNGTLDGVATAERIAEEYDIPVIFLTAYADSETVQRAKRVGPHNYLIKPFEERELYTAVEIALYKHRLEMQLLQTRQWFQTTLASIGDGVIATDPEERIVFMNAVAEELTGWTAENTRGKKIPEVLQIADLRPESDADDSGEEEGGFHSGQTAAREGKLISRDGREMYIEYTIAPLRSPKSFIRGTVVTFHDVTDQKQQASRLRRSEQRFRAIFDNAAMGIALVDMKGHIRRSNRALEHLLGYTGEELAGEPVNVFIHREEQQDIASLHNLFLEQQQKVVSEDVQLVARDQEEKWAHLSVSMVREPEHSGPVFIFMVEDISGRKKATMALRRSEEKYRLLFENNLGGVIRQSVEGTILDCNDSLVQMLGYQSRRAIQDQTPATLFDDLRQWEKLVSELREKQQVKNHILKIRGKDNRPVWVLANLNLTRDTEHQTPVIVGNVVDITERRHAERALQESERKYRQIVESMREGLYRSAFDGTLLFVNPALLRIIGYESPEEIMGKKMGDLPVFDNSTFEEFLATVQAQSEVKNFQSVWQTKDGREISVRQNAHLETDPAGTIRYIEGTVEDVTEQKELESQLFQAQKMESLGHLAGGIAHDFNNVMATISAAAQLLDLKISKPKLKKYTDMIGGSIERGKAITERMLTFTGLEEPQFQPVAAREFLANFQTILMHTLPKNIEVIIGDFQGNDLLTTDKGQLQHVLINLCINAAQAMPEGGTIRLNLMEPPKSMLQRYRIKEDQDYLCLEVADTGMGIDEEILPKIFDPFFTTKKPGEGTGLGLSVVYKIIQNHQGWVHVESEAGAGTSFVLGLPVPVSGPAAHHEAEQVHYPSGRRQRILIVDDEPVIRETLSEYLVMQGYQTTMAKNAEDALVILRPSPEEYALVITDIGLPKTDGIELVQKIHALKPDLKVIGNTGYTRIHDIDEVRDWGFEALIRKPYRLEKILRMVGEILKGT